MQALADKSAYERVLGFLRRLHEHWGWFELGGLLGGMWPLNDGRSFDEAISDDWSAFVARMRDSGQSDAPSMDDALTFKAMLFFLDRVFDLDHDTKIADVIRSMCLSNGIPVGPGYLDLWNASTADVRNNREVDPFLIRKGDEYFEVRRGK